MMGFKPRIERYNGWYLIVDASFSPALEIARRKTRIEADILLCEYMEKAQCYGKEAFATQHQADCQAGRYAKDFNLPYRTYQCDICKYYHLTTKPQTRIRA